MLRSARRNRSPPAGATPRPSPHNCRAGSTRRATAVGKRILEQRAHIRRAPRAREGRVGGLDRALGGPPAVGDDRDPLFARRDVADARHPGDRLFRESRQPPARRRGADRCEQHVRAAARRRQSAGCRGLRWTVEPLQRLTDQAALRGLPRRRIVRRVAVGGLLGKLAEGEGPRAVEDEAVGGVAIAGIDVPAIGRGADQHCPRDRRRFAQRLLERADRGRAGGDPRPPVERFVRGRLSSQPSPAAIGVGPVSGAGSTPTVSHAAPSSSATICGSAVQMPWPVSACGTATVIRPSRAILMKVPNACSPRRDGKIAAADGAAKARRRRPARGRRRRRSAMSAGRGSTRVSRLQRLAVDLAGAEPRQGAPPRR